MDCNRDNSLMIIRASAQAAGSIWRLTVVHVVLLVALAGCASNPGGAPLGTAEAEVPSWVPMKTILEPGEIALSEEGYSGPATSAEEIEQASPAVAVAMGARNPGELSAEKKPEDLADAAGVGPTAASTGDGPAPFQGNRTVVWRLLEHLEDFSLVQGIDGRIPGDSLNGIAYPNPFFHASGELEPLVMRMVAAQRDARNFDMRGGLMLPANVRLVLPLPETGGNARLHFSMAPFEKAFKGGNGAAQVTVKLDGLEAWSSKVEPTGRERGWNEVTLELPLGVKELELSTSSPQETSMGTALAHVHITEPGRVEAPHPRMASGPNMVILFVDALRSDCVGPGNPGFPSVTPFLDSLAAKGVAFVNAFSVANQTRPSIVGFLQSQHPTVGGFHCRWWNIRPEDADAYYKAGPPLIPLLLRKAGYTTISIGRNHFQYGTTKLGLDPGFDIVWDNRDGEDDTENVIARASEFFKANSDRKFLLLVNISPPHQPYTAPAEYDEWTKARLAGSKVKIPARTDYLGEVHYADSAYERLIKVMGEQGLMNRGYILVTADHGEVMRTHHSCKSQLYETICNNSHGLTLYDEEVHVPLIWFGPGLVPRVAQNIVSHLDVAPTILELLGLPLHPAHTGRSLAGELKGTAEPAADEVIYLESRLSSAIRDKGWKFILHHKKDDALTPSWKSGGNGVQELYDLVADPDEEQNLTLKFQERQRVLREQLGTTRNGFKALAEAGAGKPWLEDAQVDSSEGKVVESPKEMPEEPSSRSVVQPGEAAEPESSRESDRPGESAEEAPAPAGPEPGKEAGAADKGQYNLLITARDKAAVELEILVEGELRSPACLGSCDGFGVVGGNRILVDTGTDQEGRWIRFSTTPPDAPVTLRGQIGGRPLEPGDIFTGRFGVAMLPATGWSRDQAWSLLQSSRPASRLPGQDQGIFVWRTGPLPRGKALAGESPEDSEFGGKEQMMDSTTTNILKEYGYWK